MFRNHLVTALRNFTRHKLYSFINLAGLAVAFTCAIFIALFVRDEVSYNDWIAGSGDIYRVEIDAHYPGFPAARQTAAPFPLGAAMQDTIPAIRSSTREVVEGMTVQKGDRQFAEDVAFVDPNFFDVIQLPLIAGRADRVFSDPNGIVLTEAAARKYFGDQNPLGRTLTLGGRHLSTVTGVLRDPPHNSTFQEKVFASNKSGADQFGTKGEWFDQETYTYVRLLPHSDLHAVLAQASAIIRNNADPSSFVRTELTADDILRPVLVRLSDLHLEGNAQPDGSWMPADGSWTMVYGFVAIAILILAIACFNFTNLATARAMIRAREVGLRKVMGARRVQLVAQFLGESVLNSAIALAIALAAVEVLSPTYEAFLSRPLTLEYASNWPLILGIAGTMVVVGVLSGIYPALVLSGFRPAATLRSGPSGNMGSGILRTTLVVLQFAISIGLGAATLVVFSQIRYAQQLDLGFNRDNVVVLSGLRSIPEASRESLVQRVTTSPYVSAATQSSGVPFGSNWQGTAVSAQGWSRGSIMRILSASPDFYDFYGIKLLTGRLLSSDRGTDVLTGEPYSSKVASGKNILINAAAAHKLGFTPESAVGKIVHVGPDRASVRIVGVVTDAKFRGAYGPVDATVYVDRPFSGYSVSIRVKGGHIPEALAFIDATWHQFAPNVAVTRTFLDDDFDALFRSDQRQGAMFGLFVAIAIFIACLGLFGLAAFTAERRTKEIGIRKTFGAHTRDIVRLLLWQFSIPVLIANVIAWPVAYYYLNQWLEGFAFRITLSPLYFVVVGAATLAIAWATVFTHALRVARANPVYALRYE
jgi:putative ABC transport system permease protein